MKTEAFFGRSPFVGYIAAVTTAAACFVLVNMSRMFMSFMFSQNRGFESATNNSLGTKAMHLGIMMLGLFIIGWIFAFVTAIIPFAVGWFMAIRLKIRSVLFYISGGVVTAILLAPLAASIPSLGINVQGEEPSLLHQSLSMSPIFALCGALAGTVCWKIILQSPGTHS